MICVSFSKTFLGWVSCPSLIHSLLDAQILGKCVLPHPVWKCVIQRYLPLMPNLSAWYQQKSHFSSQFLMVKCTSSSNILKGNNLPPCESYFISLKLCYENWGGSGCFYVQEMLAIIYLLDNWNPLFSPSLRPGLPFGYCSARFLWFSKNRSLR